jgi:hypothetical protein
MVLPLHDCWSEKAPLSLGYDTLYTTMVGARPSTSRDDEFEEAIRVVT